MIFTKTHQFHQISHYNFLSMCCPIKRTEIFLELSSVLPFLEFTFNHGFQLAFLFVCLNHWIKVNYYLEPRSHLPLSCYTLIRNIAQEFINSIQIKIGITENYHCMMRQKMTMKFPIELPTLQKSVNNKYFGSNSASVMDIIHIE